MPRHVIDTTQPPDTAAEPPAATRPGGGDSVSPGLRQGGIDLAALWRQVEVETARVVVIDLERFTILTGRVMNGPREKTAHVTPESPLGRLFPRADTLVRRWAAELGKGAALVVHDLSPRHWAYFWRLGPKVAMLAAVRHRYGRGAVAAGDAATIQLLCEHWLAPEIQAMADGRAVQKRAFRADRRTRVRAQRELRVALAVLALAIACGAWLATGGASAPPPDPDAPTLAEQQRLTRLADETLVRSLTRALAEHNPLLAQLTLDEHLLLGHYTAAVVLDARQLVAARAGLSAPAEAGQALTPAATAALGPDVRRFALRQADVALGQLLLVPRTAVRAAAQPASGVEPWPDTVKRVVGALLVLSGLLAGLRLHRQLREHER